MVSERYVTDEVMQEIEVLAEEVLNGFSLSYKSLHEAKKKAVAGRFFYCFDAFSLCYYKNGHNMNEMEFQYFGECLKRLYDDREFDRETNKQRGERVSLFHYLNSPRCKYRDYEIEKRERPDFQLSNKQCIGIEIVRLTSEENEVIRKISEKHIGEGKTAAKVYSDALKEHGNKVREYLFFDVGDGAAIGSGVINIDKIIKDFEEQIWKKYAKYRNVINKFDRFVILADAKSSKGIEITSKSEADNMIEHIRTVYDEIRGVSIAVLWDDGSGYSMEEYDV